MILTVGPGRHSQGLKRLGSRRCLEDSRLRTGPICTPLAYIDGLLALFTMWFSGPTDHASLHRDGNIQCILMRK